MEYLILMLALLAVGALLFANGLWNDRKNFRGFPVITEIIHLIFSSMISPGTIWIWMKFSGR